jgi:peptidoglycan/LPS O-acetylase OafA/YrhL
MGAMHSDQGGQSRGPISRLGKIPHQSFGSVPTQFFRERLWEPFRNSISEVYYKQYYPLGYCAGLDGLRGVLTLGIIAEHSNYSLPGSLFFMDIFYVMSGYLITGLLIKDIRRHGRVLLFQFYSRRLFRLVPPLAAMIAGFLLFCCLYFPDFKKWPHWPALDAGIAFLYMTNWWRALDWQPGITYMGHTWSLAVEEQFYLLWPLTFLILFRLLGFGRRLVASILTIALAIWGWRCWITWQGASWNRVYNGFDTRADALLVGCALAVVVEAASVANLDHRIDVHVLFQCLGESCLLLCRYCLVGHRVGNGAGIHPYPATRYRAAPDIRMVGLGVFRAHFLCNVSVALSDAMYLPIQF